MFSRFEGWESNQTVCLQNFSSLLLGRSDENRAGVETDGIWGVAYTHFLVADVVPYISRHLVSSHGPGAQWRRGPGMGSLPSRSLQLAGGRAHARNRSRRQCDKTRLRIRERTLLGDEAGLPSRYVTIPFVPFLGRLFSV